MKRWNLCLCLTGCPELKSSGGRRRSNPTRRHSYPSVGHLNGKFQSTFIQIQLPLQFRDYISHHDSTTVTTMYFDFVLLSAYISFTSLTIIAYM